MSILETVSKGINKREESNSIDFQALTYSKHFQHSKSCLPYMTSKIMSTTTLHLKAYKRNLLKPRNRQIVGNRNSNQHGMDGTPQITLNRSRPHTLDAYGFVKRAAQQADKQ